MERCKGGATEYLETDPIQSEEKINASELKKHLKTVPNWKAPGPDEIYGHWLKNCMGLHNRKA